MDGAVQWVTPPSVIRVNLARLEAGTRLRVNRLLRTTAVRWEALAKTQAPWTNRTGMARATLHADATMNGMGGEIVLSHGMDYGIWLEIANGGRYQVIDPTMQVMVAELENGLQGLLG